MNSEDNAAFYKLDCHLRICTGGKHCGNKTVEEFWDYE